MLQVPKSVWIFSAGRLSAEVGKGFTVFYGPIVFVNQIGLTATDVGITVGISAMCGIVARILSGALCDSTWGAKRTLLLSGLVSVLGALLLAMTHDFSSLLMGQVLVGAGLGLYWPASDAMIVATANVTQHRDAYTLAHSADHLGLGLGIIAGSTLVSLERAYQVLFTMNALGYALFTVIVAIALPQVDCVHGNAQGERQGNGQGQIQNKTARFPWHRWGQALRDRTLLLYLVLNTLFIIYIASMQAILPLFLNNTAVEWSGEPLPTEAIGALFTGHIILCAVLQIPVSRVLRSLDCVPVLGLSAMLWCAGFTSIWGLSELHRSPSLIGVMSLALFAIAVVTYAPSAASFVARIAPSSLRGTYLSFHSLCWALGFAIGPPLGGMAIDAGAGAAVVYWLVLALSAIAVTGGLYVLSQRSRPPQSSPVTAPLSAEAIHPFPPPSEAIEAINGHLK